MRIQPRGESAFATANGLRFHYLSYGVGELEILILPGITSPAITWEFVAEELARDYRVLTMDLRGRGLSDRGASGTYRETDYALDVADFMEAVGLVRPVVLGHSMGARIATAFGALYPDKHGPLLMVDPPLCGPGRDPYPTPIEPYVQQIRQANAGAKADDIRPFFPTWTDEQLEIRADWLVTCDETAVVESYHNFHAEDFFEHWPRCRAPVGLLWGGDGPVFTRSSAAEVARANPEATVTAIPNAGHMIPWDDLPGFLAETRAFLADAAAG